MWGGGGYLRCSFVEGKVLSPFGDNGYITNSQYDQLPVGLIAQLVEHCTGIAEVMGPTPVFSQLQHKLLYNIIVFWYGYFILSKRLPT